MRITDPMSANGRWGRCHQLRKGANRYQCHAFWTQLYEPSNTHLEHPLALSPCALITGFHIWCWSRGQPICSPVCIIEPSQEINVCVLNAQIEQPAFSLCPDKLFVSVVLSIYLKCIVRKRKERKSALSTHSPTLNGCNVQAKATCVELHQALPRGCRGPSTHGIFHHFPRISAGSWAKSKGAGAQTQHSHQCWHYRKKLNLLCHNGNFNNFSFVLVNYKP